MAVATVSARQTATSSPADMIITNPVTGGEAGRVPHCTPADMIAAIDRARQAQPAWGALRSRQRARIFIRFHDLILDRQDDLFDILQAETGKSRRDCFVEVFAVAAEARYYAIHGGRFLKPHRVQPALPFRNRVTVAYQPFGVVGVISPWNFPFILSVNDAIPALLAGNAVVNKPSPFTPLSAIWARDRLLDAGLPPDLFQVVTGPGKDLAETLIDHVDYVMFTGSSEVGKLVAQRAAARLTPFTVELGGKNALIVLDDADLKHAARVAVEGAFNNCGQVCVNWERIYVQRGIYEPFVDEMKRLTAQLRLGATRDYDTDLGSMISPQHVEKSIAHIEDAINKGARLVAGGRRRDDLGPAFYEPAILEGVTSDMAVHAEETFGPVVSVYPFDEVDEAMRLANDSRYGLYFGVFGGNRRRAEQIARQLRVGTVAVNDTYAGWAAMEAPLGGFKESGIGRRHGGADGIRKFTESQTIITNLTPIQISSYETALSINRRLARVLTLLLKVWRHVPFIR